MKTYISPRINLVGFPKEDILVGSDAKMDVSLLDDEEE